MAATVIKEFLATLGFQVDESSQRKFVDGINAMTAEVLKFSDAMAAAATGVISGLFKMADAGEQMYYFAQRVGDTVTNINAFTFAMSKMGLSPQEAMANLQKLGDMLRNDPGMRSLFESYAGTGSREEQLRRFQEFYKNSTPEMQRILRQQFGNVFTPEFFMALGRQDLGIEEENYKRMLRRFGFDPDRFSQDSVKFENAFRDVQARLNIIWGRFNQELIDKFTTAFGKMAEWLDQHAKEINQAIDIIAKGIGYFADGLVRVVDAAMKLTPEQKEVILALFAGIAIALGGISKYTVIFAALSALLIDFEKFKETGQSGFGIDWDYVGKKLTEFLGYVNSIKDALGGWQVVFEILIGMKIASWLGGVTVAMNLLGVSTGIMTGSLRLLVGVLSTLASIPGIIALLAAVGGYGAYKEGEQQGKAAEMGFRPSGRPGSMDESGNVLEYYNPTTGQYLNTLEMRELQKTGKVPGTTPEPPPATKQEGNAGGTSIWDKLSTVLQYLNPIAVAKGEELPDNIKQLNQTMKALNDNFQEQLTAGITANFGQQFGGSVGQGQGPGPGGAHVDPKALTDPAVLESVKFFMSKGYSLPQAIGLVSNLFNESGLDPNAINQTGHVGIAQWDRNRAEQFRKMFGHGVREGSLQEQLEFVAHELATSEKASGDRLRGALDESQASDIINRGYERSDDFSGRRGATARALMSRPEYQQLINNNQKQGGDFNQTNNVTIHGANDPTGVARELDHQQQRQYGEWVRYQQSALA
jgi:Phage tail lysozyme